MIELKEREKRPIELFDVKEFVKIKKRNKLFEALEGNRKEESKEEAPRLGSMMVPPMRMIDDEDDEAEEMDDKAIANIFNPFNIPSSSQAQEEIKEEPKEETVKYNINDLDKKLTQVNIENKTEVPKFDLDSIVKRIDAKIAELEEQERQEKEKQQEEKKEESAEPKEIKVTHSNEEAKEAPEYDRLDNTIVERFDDFMREIDDATKDEHEPIINVDNDSVVVGDVTDDQYYDDFFGDDNDNEN